MLQKHAVSQTTFPNCIGRLEEKLLHDGCVNGCKALSVFERLRVLDIKPFLNWQRWLPLDHPMKPGLEYGWRLPIWYLYPYPPPHRKYISANANVITGGGRPALHPTLPVSTQS